MSPAPARPAAPSETALRLLERVREMVQDAAAKGERLSATGEAASRAAERVVRTLEEEAATLSALAQRLGAEEEPPCRRRDGPGPPGRPEAARSRGAGDPAPARRDARDAEDSR